MNARSEKGKFTKGKLEDLTGQKFNKLTVIEYVGNRTWRCKCECGNYTNVNVYNLKRGHTKSCGCLRGKELSLRFNDLTGQRFGRLTVIELCGKTKDGSMKWRCKCDCGNVIETSAGRLRGGTAKSCGCYSRDKASEVHKKHGLTHSRIYSIWSNMKQRCYNPNCIRYKSYGGRGIKICDEWLGECGFDNFAKWSFANGYADNLSIDRINNDKGYSPDNCRWVSEDVQKYNKTTTHYVEINGVTKALKEWCDLGIYEASFETVMTRIQRGWDDVSAITKPIRKKKAEAISQSCEKC